MQLSTVIQGLTTETNEDRMLGRFGVIVKFEGSMIKAQAIPDSIATLVNPDILEIIGRNRAKTNVRSTDTRIKVSTSVCMCNISSERRQNFNVDMCTTAYPKMHRIAAPQNDVLLLKSFVTSSRCSAYRYDYPAFV